MFQVYDSNSTNVISNPVFMDAFKNKWDDLHQRPGIFRYQINKLPETIIDGKYLLQLNPNRNAKRRKPQYATHIRQPFDDSQFNFTKVTDEEIMFTLKEDSDDICDYKHVIVVNVSPINRYHSLLCPFIDSRLPQIISPGSLKLALEIMLLMDDRSLKIGFNSLCALASVNHLHYHLLFEYRTLAVEIAKRKQLKGPVHTLEYIVPTFYLKVDQNTNEAADIIMKLLRCLLWKEIAHNILITRGRGNEADEDAIGVFVWPRKSGVKRLGAFNVAVCELAGWFPVYDALDFADMQGDDLEDELKTVKYEEFDELCDEIKSLF